MRLIEPDEFRNLPQGILPSHVAIVMDGNGRWAEYKGFERTRGHYAAKQPAFDCIQVALELGIPWLTFYAFSAENWTRPKGELAVLLNYPQWAFTREAVDTLKQQGVRFLFIGNLADERIPPAAREWFQNIENETAQNNSLTLAVAFNYSGQAEIIEAARRAIRENADPDRMDITTFTSFLQAPEMPPVDLLIRTSGEQRVSNFLLWHMAYAELVFFDTLWPDFGKGHFLSALHQFQIRYRRYGGLPWIGSGANTTEAYSAGIDG